MIILRILADLEILLNQKIQSGRTLLFIDEIQASPRAIMSLRYFYEELSELHVVAADSLIEFTFKDISVAVGRVQFLQLHPLSFSEYLLATGKDEAVEVVLGVSKAVPQAVHEFLS